jgi:hypothetical protein
MRHRFLRAAVAASFLWFALLSAIAGYEAVSVDPWSFLGENRGPMFFVWSPQVVFDGTSFGNVELVFDVFSFWGAVLLPVAALIAVAIIAERIQRSMRRSRRYYQ